MSIIRCSLIKHLRLKKNNLRWAKISLTFNAMRFLFLLLSVFGGSYYSYSQDTLITRDSIKEAVKLIEISQTQLKYKRFNNPDGPLFVIDKSQVYMIIYQNGKRELFESTQPVTDIFVNTVPPKGSTRRKVSVGDYIKFNLYAGIAFQNSNSNRQRRDDDGHSKTGGGSFSKHSNETFSNFTVGVNGLFGNSPYMKHVISVNYLRSTGEFDYSSYQSGYVNYAPTKYYKKSYYSSKADFINIVTGVRFTIADKFSIEPLVAFNYMTHANVVATSTVNSITYSGGPTPTIIKDETTVTVEKNPAEKQLENTVSFCPRISYEFKLKDQKIGMCFSYNMAYKYRLPWYMLGITWYPFKKLQ